MEEDQSTSVLSHEEAMAFVEEGIDALIRSDPLLQHLPFGVTTEELEADLALTEGRAMSVFIRRADDQTYCVTVEKNATVYDLKKAIRQAVARKLKREGSRQKISWRYIWKTYWLYFENQKLTEDHKPLKSYNIQHNSELTFIKRLRKKN